MSQAVRSIDAPALRRFIESGGMRFRNGPQSWIFTCPKCSGKDKLYIRKRDGRFRCMKCGPEFNGWSTDWALSELTGEDRREIRGQLFGGHDTAGTEISLDWEDHWSEFGYEDDEIEVTGYVDLPELTWDPDIIDLTDPWAQKGVQYLQKRGVTPTLAQKYRVRYHASDERVVFPVEVDGVLRGWQGRYIGETDLWNEQTLSWFHIPKVMTTGALGGKCMMFQDNLKNSPHALMVEGPIDCLKADLCGGNVATMGKGVTNRQLDLIESYGIKKLYIGLDPDADEDIERVARNMQGRDITCYRIDPPTGAKDLGDATPEAVLAQFRSAYRIKPGQLFVYFEARPW